MGYIVFKTVGGKKLYLAPSGKWIKTKVYGASFGTREDAQQVADTVAGGVDYHKFRI